MVICLSFDLYDLNRSIDDEGTISFSRKAILFDKSDVNKLVHDHRENLNHFSAKITLHTAPPYVLHEHFLLLTVRFLFYPT